jgi:uncharacterized protein (TIGR02145 family)
MKTIKIGDQEWMSESLNVSTFRNGEAIAHAQTVEQWQKAGEYGIAAWRYYDNHPENGLIFGKLYNFFAVSDPRGISPEGWHVPTDDEWQSLVDFLGGDRVAGEHLKSKERWKPTECQRCLGWDDFRRISEVCADCNNKNFPRPPGFHRGGINSSGFNALPGGYLHGMGGFYAVGRDGYWWSSSDAGLGSAWYRVLSFNFAAVNRTNTLDYRSGFSVRCARD